MKKLLSIITAAVLSAAIISSCGNAPQNGHKVRIRDEFLSDEVKVKFLNTDTGDTEEVTPKKLDQKDDMQNYECSADPEKFDRMVITSDGDDSIELAFNEYVNGWDVTSNGYVPVSDKPADYAIKNFKYEKTTKTVYIWLPDGYDKSSKTKYSVIYMTDGQNLFDPKINQNGCWNAAESVQAMMSNSKHKAIVVGIDDSTSNRDSELTPDIGNIAEVTDKENFENGTGKYYSDFVYNTVVPYIEKNYNVYTDPEHNALCGSSSGGIECFYIGMEHPDKFGTIGAMSPAFSLYDDETWIKYLKTKDFSKYQPKVYITNGVADELEKFLLPGAKSMKSNLKLSGFPEKNVTVKIYEKGMHNEAYWRALFPEFLTIMFPAEKAEK
jgi:predicted alpha/beta superfamily hydrolase